MVKVLYTVFGNHFRNIHAIGNDASLKVILECYYLTSEEIVRAAEVAVQAEADWIKTGTGWAPTGATFENVALLKKTIGNAAKIKAAGGIRNIETLEKMIELGAERFGIGAKTVVSMFEQSATC